MGMRFDAFIDDTYAGSTARKDEVAVERAQEWCNAIEPQRQEQFCNVTEAMKGVYKNHS